MTKVFDFIDEAREKLWLDKREEIMALVDPETNKVYQHMVSRVNCPICDIDNVTWVFGKEGFDFVRCRQCGLLHVNPQLKPDVAESFYKQSKTATNWIRVQRGSKEQDWNAQKKYLPALKELEQLRPDGGRLLDVGCSIGQFLNISRDYGWLGEGIELNHEAAEFARQKYGLTVFDKKLEDLGLEDESYDLITLWGVLEHLTHPNLILKDVRRLLKKNGLLLLFVPNGHSLIVRLTRYYNSTVSGRAHLWYFTPKTIGQILNNNGFRKKIEFSVLPQLHEIQHFLQYNILYKEPDILCDDEFVFDDDVKEVLEKYIDKKKMGYKLITIAEST
jgi:2-polyprenyl-3-methyl-5-hydroxy-6-metoxy-1,4-benzoquinol methylase